MRRTALLFLAALTIWPTPAVLAQDEGWDSERPWVGIALSGGGLRATAFSHGVMLELSRFCVPKTRDGELSYHELKHSLEMREKHSDPCQKLKNKENLLDSLEFLAGVSGGSITAGYYMTHGPSLEGFRTVLQESGIRRRLIAGEKPSSSPLLRIVRPFALLLAAAIDTALLPLSLLPIGIETAPFATMALYDGLLEGEQLVPIFDSTFFNGKRFGDLDRVRAIAGDPLRIILRAKQEKRMPELLISATDIKNGRIFTFDRTTFECMGAQEGFQALPIAVASAASSSLPGVFAPIELEDHLESIHPDKIPRHCAPILADMVRAPVLVDGGVGDNLGIVGLLKRVFEAKGRDVTSDHNPKRQRLFLISVNAATNADSSLPRLARHLDSSFDMLMRDKTDLSRLLAGKLLSNFGIEAVELRFTDIVKNPEVVRRIVDLKGAQVHRGRTARDAMRESAGSSFDLTEMEQRVLHDLNSIDMLPSAEQIDLLIAAGRAIVAEMSEEIMNAYRKLAGKDFANDCDAINNPDRFYCWPKSFEIPHLLANKIGVAMEQVTQTSAQFIEKSTENKLAVIRQIQNDAIRNDKDDELRQNGLLPPVVLLRQVRKRILDDVQLAQIYGLYDYPGDWLSSSGDFYHLLKVIDDIVKHESLLKDGHIRDEDQDEIQGEESQASLLEACMAAQGSPRELQRCQRVQKLMTRLEEEGGRNARVLDSAYYYLLMAWLNNAAGRTDEAFRLLYTGVSKFPNQMSLVQLLGYYLFILKEDFRGGIGYLERAAAISDEHLRRLTNVKEHLVSPRDWEMWQDQYKRMEIARDWFNVLVSRFTAISPVPLPSRPQQVPDIRVEEWIQSNLSDEQGRTYLDRIREALSQLREEWETYSVTEEGKRVIEEMDAGNTLSHEIQLKKCEMFLAVGSGDSIKSKTPEPLLSLCQVSRTLEKREYDLAWGPEVIEAAKELRLSILRFTVSLLRKVKKLREQEETKMTSIQDASVACKEAPILSAFPQDSHRLCSAMAHMRYQVRVGLAKREGDLTVAIGLARSIYERRAKDDFIGPGVLADNYGLVLLATAGHRGCPERGESIRHAKGLFREAEASLGATIQKAQAEVATDREWQAVLEKVISRVATDQNQVAILGKVKKHITSRMLDRIRDQRDSNFFLVQIRRHQEQADSLACFTISSR